MARSNDAAAQMLQEFAELLAISGGDPFRVRSYEKAARSVAGYHAEIASLDVKGLDAIPNVGSHLAAKIVEFHETGYGRGTRRAAAHRARGFADAARRARAGP